MSSDLTVSLDLVRRAQDGDRSALDRLFERYYERVRRVVRLRLGRELRRSVDSGDILQDTFIAAVRSFEGFEPRDEASLINWLSRLAERQILGAADRFGAKKRDRKREVPLGSDGEGARGAVPDLEAPGSQPFEVLAVDEENALVETCLHELPEEHREIVILRDYVGMQWEMIARETGRPTAAAARMMYARAVVELGKLVRARGVVPGS